MMTEFVFNLIALIILFFLGFKVLPVFNKIGEEMSIKYLTTPKKTMGFCTFSTILYAVICLNNVDIVLLRNPLFIALIWIAYLFLLEWEKASDKPYSYAVNNLPITHADFKKSQTTVFEHIAEMKETIELPLKTILPKVERSIEEFHVFKKCLKSNRSKAISENMKDEEVFEEMYDEFTENNQTQISKEDFLNIAFDIDPIKKYDWVGELSEVVKLFYVIHPHLKEERTGTVKDYILKYFHIKNVHLNNAFDNAIGKQRKAFSKKHEYITKYKRA